MITIVSGLPRSGTSMLMQMLAAGGMPIVTDGARKADDDNPRGYLELEKAKRLGKDASWLAEAEGKAFKVVAMLLYHLTPDRRYKIVFMRRNLDEVLASQAAMLANLGKDGKGPNDSEMRRLFEQHLKKVTAWLENQKNIEVMYCDYAETIADPAAQAKRVAAFLDMGLDVRKMAEIVDSKLYRNRKTCEN